MKTAQAYQLIQEMRDLESSRLQHIENYEEPQIHYTPLAHCYQEEAREVFNRRLANHRTIVKNLSNRIDALDIALRALHHFDVNT